MATCAIRIWTLLHIYDPAQIWIHHDYYIASRRIDVTSCTRMRLACLFDLNGGRLMKE